MGRAPCCDKANVKRGPWSPEEDATLKAYIEEHGTGGNWIALPQKIGLKRCGKSCRLRWLNYLRPNIKHGGFTEEEDNIICSLYISIGSRWSIIAAQLPGRTDNDIKNYWNTRLKKKMLGRRKLQSQMNRSSSMAAPQDQKPSEIKIEEENPFMQNLSNSAMERLQLHMQLQNLQNPISMLNNLLQEKMLQALQNIPMQSMIPSSSDLPPPQSAQNLNIHENTRVITPSVQEDSNVSVHGTTNFDTNMILQENEHGNNFLNVKSGVVPELDSFMWWSSNEIDTNSASSSSWDSTSLLQQSEGMYHVDRLGYRM